MCVYGTYIHIVGVIGSGIEGTVVVGRRGEVREGSVDFTAGYRRCQVDGFSQISHVVRPRPFDSRIKVHVIVYPAAAKLRTDKKRCYK